jgi:D-alanine-D-alanine ligase
VIFNLVEVFNQKYFLDKNVACVFELLQIPYTGSSPQSLLLCGNKALTKKILTYHKIRVPGFYTFYRGKKIWLPKKLNCPIIVKPLTDEASMGLSQASVVDNEKDFVERVRFLQEKMDSDVIAEEYIDGREFYVSIIGSKKLRVLPIREMKFGKFPEDEPRIATYKAKWDYDYRKRWGIQNVFSSRLSEGLKENIENVCKRAYRALDMGNYARFDIRVDSDSRIFILEANANPSLDKDDELGMAAEKAGISYPELVKEIVSLSFKRA